MPGFVADRRGFWNEAETGKKFHPPREVILCELDFRRSELSILSVGVLVRPEVSPEALPSQLLPEKEPHIREHHSPLTEGKNFRIRDYVTPSAQGLCKLLALLV